MREKTLAGDFGPINAVRCGTWMAATGSPWPRRGAGPQDACRARFLAPEAQQLLIPWPFRNPQRARDSAARGADSRPPNRIAALQKVQNHQPLALDLHLSARFQHECVAQECSRLRGNLNASGLAMRFHPAGGVDGVAPQIIGESVHWHILYADGAWCETEKGLEFLQGPPLKQEVVQQVFEDVLKRIDRQIAKLPDPIESPAETQRKCDPALSALLRNAMLGFQSDGKDAGKPQQAEFGKGPLKIRKDGRNCCKANGYSLHANRTIAPQDREGLEKLCRYLCRPAIPASRLELLENPIGNKTIRIWLKSEWEGGIKSVLVSEKDLVIRALAQIPLPFRRQLIYHGCFAGNSKARAKVVLAGDKPKGRRKKKKADDKAEKTEPEENTKMLWQIAHLRCFGWDVLKCPCGGNRTLIAAVKKKTEIERFLRFLKLWPNADDVVSVHGPPEDFDIDEFERQADWDDFYESEELNKAHDENWSA